jgi:hypothetical protein
MDRPERVPVHPATKEVFCTLMLLHWAAAAWPLASGAQQRAKPVIGYLSLQEIAARPQYLATFRRATEGFVEGQSAARA